MTKKELETKKKLPPGNLGLPWIGETLSFLTDPNFIDKRQKLYGSIFQTKILGRPTVIAIGSEANRFIMSTGAENFSNDGWPDSFQTLLGKQALVLQEGVEHQRNRKLLMPTLHGKALAHYITTMEKISIAYLRSWEEMGCITWFPQFRKMTFDISSNLLIGSEPGETNECLFQWFLEVSKGLFAFPLPWRWTPFGKALEARAKILDYIETAMATRELSPKEDVLTLLMQVRDERGKGLTASEIKSQTLALLLGSIGNTASMLTCMCMALAQHPDILAKARIEQQEIVREEPLKLEHLKQMTYLEQILKEVERRYPPVGAGFRRVIKPFVFKGYYVPQNWNVMYSIIGTHNESRIYPEPKRFDPERFSPENMGSLLTDFNLIGFGGGNRNCIGIAFAKTLIKVFTSHLIRHYNWELLPKQNLTLNSIPILCPRSGLKVKLWSVPQAIGKVTLP